MPPTRRRVAVHQHEVAGLDHHVSPSADGDAEVGLGERGCIVHAIADHAGDLALGLGFPNTLALCSGSTSVKTRSMLTCFATTSAVLRLPPSLGRTPGGVWLVKPLSTGPLVYIPHERRAANQHITRQAKRIPSMRTSTRTLG